MNSPTRTSDPSKLTDLLAYLEDAPLGDVGEIIIGIELRHPVDSFAKRRQIAHMLGFSPEYYRENVAALFELPAADRDFPSEMAQLRARRSA